MSSAFPAYYLPEVGMASSAAVRLGGVRLGSASCRETQLVAVLALQPDRIRNLLRLAAGYLPGTVVLLGGWMWVRDHVTHPIENRRGFLVGLGALRRSAFTAPSLEMMSVRTMNLAELASWA